MDIVTIIILGIVQGITEFLPISSTGHLVLAREFLGLPATDALAIDALLYLATAFAVGIYFRKDFLRLVYAFLYRITGRKPDAGDERMLILLTIATVPVLISGFFLGGNIETVFRDPVLIVWTLIAGSAVFIAAEWVGKRYAEQGVVPSKWRALSIGLFQVVALIPGMSRSGMTISGGLFLGLTREAAARFGFLLSFPVILFLGGRRFFELSGNGILDMYSITIFWGVTASFVSSLFAIHFLLKFVRTHSLTVFAVYRVLLAIFVLWWML